MKTFETIRLFGPLLLGAAFTLVFTVFMHSNLKEAQSGTEEAIALLEIQAKKYAGLNDEKKVKIAEWLLEQDVGGYTVLFETSKDVVKTYRFLIIILMSAIAVQIVSLLSYYFLEKRYATNAINHNGLRLTVTLIGIGILFGIYLIIKGRYWISNIETFWLFAVGACVTAVILWRLIKRSMVAAWLLLGLSGFSFVATIALADYTKLFSPAIYLYLALEVVMSVRGLRKEESNNGFQATSALTRRRA